MSDVSVTIRATQPSDATQLIDLLKQLGIESDEFETDDLSDLGEEEEAEQIRLINQSRDDVILVAAVDDRLVAVATVSQLNRKQGEFGIAVSQAFQGIGLGTALSKEAIRWFLNNSSLSELTLDVYRDNKKAIHLYQKVGFAEKARISNLIKMKYKKAEA